MQWNRAGFLCAALAVAALALALSAAPARADWLKAESERFLIYSDGPERELREYAQKLETFDRVLRLYMGLDLDTAPIRKLPIYLLRNHRDIQRAFPHIGSGIAGFYTARDEDIFAVASATRGEDYVLLHEYAHHFMLQNFSYGYPAWFVEGFAEYYMTAVIRPGVVEVGRHNENRGWWLMNSAWIPIEQLLTSGPRDVRRNGQTYYPLAWLLTHWFMGDEARSQQLHAYMLDIGEGGHPVEAMERATGLSMADLRRALTRYLHGRIPAQRLTYPFPEIPVTVTRLPRSANDLLLINQRLKVGAADDEREALAAEVRRLAARHPGDDFAQLALGHAELHFGDARRGEALLADLLERQPDHIEALQLMASARIAAARTAQTLLAWDEYDQMMRQARAFLARAYALDDGDYQTLYLLALTREGAPNYPNDNDVLTWRYAHVAAPQLATTRFGYAHVLMTRGDNEQAVEVLRPLANSPHGGAAADAAQAMIDQALGIPPESGGAANDDVGDDDAEAGFQPAAA